jgi:hypothetical protein
MECAVLLLGELLEAAERLLKLVEGRTVDDIAEVSFDAMPCREVHRAGRSHRPALRRATSGARRCRVAAAGPAALHL